ncbi:MAG TPA: AraC family transcriptional regulator [Chryseolinea sp.]|nr:AraC family transcriptional regulator [Chryseolinea sp.]
MDNIEYETLPPTAELGSYVKIFWRLQNKGSKPRKVVILPDGYFDLAFWRADNVPFQTVLFGLGTTPAEYTIPPYSVSFCVSFKLPAAEYLLDQKIAPVIDQIQVMSTESWVAGPVDLQNFASFTERLTSTMLSKLPPETDPRKMQLFELIYNSTGSISVQQIADSTHWTSRQINRYFTQWFGLSLKTYCNILRYRASFSHLRDGKLFPELSYSDQAHFIKEVKKFSGVTPKDLALNKNDRFIQLSTLPPK